MTRRGAAILAGWLVFGCGPLAVGSAPQGAPDAPSPSDRQAMVKRYCVSCHNERQRAAGLSPLALDGLDVNHVGARAEVWEKVLQRLRSHSMPPPGLPRPDPAAYESLSNWVEAELDRAAASAPNPGDQPSLHRLNRAEYKNAVRDLLALDHLPRELDIAALLPADDASYGFDNIADALGTTPTLLESYLAAAQKISALAVGDRSLPVIVDRYRMPLALPQDDRFDDQPFGSRGGISIRRFFPLDGEYAIQLALLPGRATDQHQLEISIDGARAHLFTVGGDGGRGRGRGGAPPDGAMASGAPAPLLIRPAVTAGTHVVSVAFVKKTAALAEDVLTPFRRSGQGESPPQPSLASVTISGPYNVAGPGTTPSRTRIFICQPATRAEEGPCAEKILSALARRAYRRPGTPADLQVLMPFYRSGRAEEGFDRGIQRALERLLVSPAFLFRVEREPASGSKAARVSTQGAGEVWRISDLELAARLSFFLWSSIPDDELLDLASRGKLADPATLERQITRMLADWRAEALATNFAAQWLALRSLDDASPDPRLFPDFDEGLRQAMRRETELFFESVVRENRSVLDFLTATDTFVNERLAKHYGIPGVYGDSFRRVTLPPGARRGLLGQASILTVTSYAHRTSPVLRGKWIMENVLGTPPPPPPPNVPTLVETNGQTGKALTMREAMSQHRANPMCASCHARMDPLGFAFENYDAVGRWRTRNADQPIDASGTLPDGTRFDGAAGLLDVIVKRPDQFASTLTERLLTYAVGRGVEDDDLPAVRAITRDAAASGYRFSAIVTGIARSVPFQMRARIRKPVTADTVGNP